MSDGVPPQGYDNRGNPPGDAQPPVDPAYASPEPAYPPQGFQAPQGYDPAYAPQPPVYAPPPVHTPPPYPQPAYPPPYPLAPQPGYGPAYPGAYPAPPHRGPSGGTAITTGVLGILVGLYQTWQAVSYLLVLSIASDTANDMYNTDTDLGGFAGFLVGMSAASALSALLMFAGAIMVLMRKSAGRWLVVVGGVLTLAVTFLPMVLASWFLSALGGELDSEAFAGLGTTMAIVGFFWALFPVLTMVFALVPPTRRYCNPPPRTTITATHFAPRA